MIYDQKQVLIKSKELEKFRYKDTIEQDESHTLLCDADLFSEIDGHYTMLHYNARIVDKSLAGRSLVIEGLPVKSKKDLKCGKTDLVGLDLVECNGNLWVRPWKRNRFA